jgi:signal transduction histidine kinase
VGQESSLSESVPALVIVEEARESAQNAKAAKDSKEAGRKMLPVKLCQFLLECKGAYEIDPESKKKVKTFTFTNPEVQSLFEPVAEELREAGIGTLVIQPMMYGDVSRGIIVLADKNPQRNFSESELVLTKVVAGQIAVSIEHANLVAELSRKNKDLVGKNLNLDSKNLELKTMQSQLIHQEKMASLGRLVAGIAHELNNPINFVHGNLPYLRQYVDELKKVIAATDSLPLEHRQPVEELKNKLKYDFLVTDLDNIIADLNEGSGRIRHIIRDLRSFSRLDEAELKEASVQEGIESTLKILSQYYGKDKIQVRADYGNLPQILCYPGQLNQVWMNLLGNAAQAMSQVSAPEVKIKGELEDNYVLVSIQDSGTGIKNADQSKIFDPFFTTKPVGQGTGLGLSICHSIIERHGGQIWFESEEGKGTTFFVRLPLNANKQELAQSGGDYFHDPD